MATFNTNATAADILSSSVAVAAAAEHYERTFIVPTSSSQHHQHHTNATSVVAPLHLEPFVTAGTPHFVTSTTAGAHHHQQQQQQHHHQQQLHHQQTNSTSSSYTFVQIKREPCQVSEVSSNNCHQQQHQQQHHHQDTLSTPTAIVGSNHHQQQQHHHHHGIGASSLSSASISASATSKTMSSSTLTTLVKIEASSPKVQEMDKCPPVAHSLQTVPAIASTNNSVPIGIAVARKRPQESSATLGNSTAIPMQQQLSKDMNCFGIRVADLGGVGGGCGNIYFTGNGDLMTSSATAEELALSAAGVQSVNRTPSTFWQYQNALPIESVISMSPATVGLQYSREASRGQVVLLPASAAALDPFQQAAAAALIWPSYTLPQSSAQAAATLQPPPNFIFPSMSPHSTLQTQPYATSLQLFGSNYLTAAAAAAAAAAATSTLCQQHNQQTNSTTSSMNLSLSSGGIGGNGMNGASLGTSIGSSCTTSTSSSCSSSTSSRFLSVATGGTTFSATAADMQQKQQKQSMTLSTQSSLPLSLPLPLPLPLSLPPPHSLIVPPTAMKIEEWNGAEYMTTAATPTSKSTALTVTGTSAPPQSSVHQTNHSLAQPHSAPPQSHSSQTVHFEARDRMASTIATTATTTNLLDLQNASNAQALNLIRLPTPPTSATIENAVASAPQILFQATSAPPPSTPALLNLSATLTPRHPAGNAASCNFLSNSNVNTNSNNNNIEHNNAIIGPPTPLDGDEITAINFKTSSTFDVVGVPRVHSQQPATGPPPQMQDVNIQTDTPVCSEDEENSSCPLAIQQQQQQMGASASTPPPTTQQQPPTDQESLYDQDSDAQQPLELTKTAAGIVNVSSLKGAAERETNNECHNQKEVEKEEALAAAAECYNEKPVIMNNSEMPPHSIISNTTNATTSPVNEPVYIAATEQVAPEDLTGLELLSNISTITLAKNAGIRVKQEPLDHADAALAAAMERRCGEEAAHAAHLLMYSAQSTSPPAPLTNMYGTQNDMQQTAITAPLPPLEPLGGLKLLCELAEQRIQEEVEQQSNSNGGVGLFSKQSFNNSNNNNNQGNHEVEVATMQARSTPQHMHIQQPFGFQQLHPPASSNQFRLEQSSFPSMDSIELPSTSSGITCFESPLKRKKRKHSKSPASSREREYYSKKNKKSKYPKEKRKNKHIPPDFDNEELTNEDLQSALMCVDPNFYKRFGSGNKWSQNTQELFSMMETDMRQRLAEITRQYRKKKRKLEGISTKNKKQKQLCSQLAVVTAQQKQLQHQQTQQLMAQANALAKSSASGGGVGASSSSSTSLNGSLITGGIGGGLADYKFANFSKSIVSGGVLNPIASSSISSSTTSSYLSPASSFLRFAESNKTQNASIAQFPPPDAASTAAANNSMNSNDNGNYKDDDSDLDERPSTSAAAASTAIYKPVRLEPSALSNVISGAVERGAVRKSASATPAKARANKPNKSNRRSSDIEAVATERRRSATSPASATTTAASAAASAVNQQQQQLFDRRDRELMLTNEHMYRSETRVLCGMGGLFYAGVMRPLRAPDVYAITLDGERGNKPQIGSREDIFSGDTILEVTPNSVENVPIGTRLCAYWSSQYRCLYPGIRIESESSDDEATTNNDFISVEFDDGDSGSIRLQDIRFLLSAYPQAEYNENPISSIGKSKKSAVKSSSSAGVASSGSGGGSVGSGGGGSVGSGGGNTSDPQSIQSAIASSDLQNEREIYAQRSEKKRIKSLKKKSQAKAAAAAAAAVNGAVLNQLPSTLPAKTTATGADITSNAITTSEADMDGNEYNRKHHKHKKNKKKHKKHHRNMEERAENAALQMEATPQQTSTATTSSSTNSSYVAKHERNNVKDTQATVIDENEHDYDDEDGDSNDVEGQRQQHNAAAQKVVNSGTAAIKQETIATNNNNNINNNNPVGVKVKTEHFEMDEESTSNMMSEVSDEFKGGNKHTNSKGSKIAAFLPGCQLWGWDGKSYRNRGFRGRARKNFYKSIIRGEEKISIGDCAVFLSTGQPDRPYIGRIVSMWELSPSNKKIVRVKWFYHPAETKGCPNLKRQGALFESPHEDENDVQTISHRCEVISFADYIAKFGDDPKQHQAANDNNDTYYLAGFYKPKVETLNLQNDIPTVVEE